MKCPYHNIPLQESQYTPSSVICPKCKEEKRLGLRDNDGIWSKEYFSNNNQSESSSEYFITNNRYVDGYVVLKALKDVFKLSEDESKRIVFDAHVYGKAKIKNCTDSRMHEFNQKMKNQGYPQDILKKNVSGEFVKQDIFDTIHPNYSLSQNDEEDEF